MMLYDFLDGRGHVPASKHPNGGGIVAATASVAPTVFLSSESTVYGYTTVRDRVRITGRNSVQGNAYPGGVSTLLEGDVQIVGAVEIRGCVLLRNHASIRGHVRMHGMVQVMHHASVAGNVLLEGDVMVLDSSYISGDIKIVAKEQQIIVRGEEVIHGAHEIYAPADLAAARAGARAARKPKQEHDARTGQSQGA